MTNAFALRWTTRSHKQRTLAHCIAAAAVLSLLTSVGIILQTNLLTIGLLYLMVVVSVASLYGFKQATFTSILAVLLLDYYFEPPIFSFAVEGPAVFIALVTFEVTALTISRLQGREMKQAREATIHLEGMERLYELSRSTLLLDLRQPPGPQIAALIERIFNVRAVALFDVSLGREDRAGEWGSGEDDLAKQCVLRDSSSDDLQSHTSQRVLRTGTGPGPAGALVVRGELNPLVVDALASLAAIAMDRHQSFESEDRAERARQGEELRATVLDALAHELKTPLAAVQTASSGLLELGGMTDSQTELVTLIDDAAVHLNELCTRMLVTARLDGGKVGLDLNDVNIRELILEVLANYWTPVESARIEVLSSDASLTVKGDRGLLAMILAQYIDNALKYSTPNTKIEVSVQENYSQALVSVHNIGPTIRIEDRERVFDRFYRAADQKEAISGTGIGLSIAKKAAEAHHGHVWVISSDKEGTTFFLSLPTEARRKQ